MAGITKPQEEKPGKSKALISKLETAKVVKYKRITFTTQLNKPKVKIFTGKKIIFTKGLANIFTKPKAKAARSKTLRSLL